MSEKRFSCSFERILGGALGFGKGKWTFFRKVKWTQSRLHGAEGSNGDSHLCLKRDGRGVLLQQHP